MRIMGTASMGQHGGRGHQGFVIDTPAPLDELSRNRVDFQAPGAVVAGREGSVDADKGYCGPKKNRKKMHLMRCHTARRSDLRPHVET